MNFHHYSWADSDVERINIEYDLASLIIWNDTLQKRLIVECSGLAGITNLCVWDDTSIMSANAYPVLNENNDFLRSFFRAYSKGMDYGGRTLDTGFLELRIELSNYIPFSIYCQNIEVKECDE